jgi:hypothetical protein
MMFCEAGKWNKHKIKYYLQHWQKIKITEKLKYGERNI